MTTKTPENKISFYVSNCHVTSRITANIPQEIFFNDRYNTIGHQIYLMDTLCVWGGADKNDECQDGSRTYSWEFRPHEMEQVKEIIARWKGTQWVENEFWREEGKRIKQLSSV